MDPTGACDFPASFITWDAPPRAEPDPRPYARHVFPDGIVVRMPLDSILDVTNEATGATERIVLCVPHRTEWCFNDPPIFAMRPLYPPQIVNTEYRYAFSPTAERNMEGHPIYPAIPARRLARSYQSRYRSASLRLKRLPATRVLSGAKEIIQAVEDKAVLVGRTELRDAGRRERYVVEYPVRVVDYWAGDDSYQVNAGPFILPDPDRTDEHVIDRLELTFIVYNQRTTDTAEFIFRRYIPVDDERGRTVSWVLNYADVRNFPVHTTLMAGEAARSSPKTAGRGCPTRGSSTDSPLRPQRTARRDPLCAVAPTSVSRGCGVRAARRELA